MSSNFMSYVALGLALVLAYTGHELGNQKTEVQVLRTAAQKARADAERVAREHDEKLATLEQNHAQRQQEITDGYTRKIAALAAGRASDSADIARLRNTIGTYAANSGTPGETDATACERAGNRLNTLAGLLAEGAELVIEGSRIVEQRDNEVGTLKALIANDRALLTQPDQPK